MFKKIAVLCLLLLFCAAGYAQSPAVKTGTITVVDAGSCATDGACVTLNLPANSATAIVQLVNRTSWTGTIQFEVFTGTSWISLYGNVQPNNGTPTWAASATAAGVWRFQVAGYKAIRVRCSAYTSGGFDVTLTSSLALATSAN